MKASTFIIFYFFLFIASPVNAQAYKGVVENFYKALGNRDFAGAYKLCTGAQWGTLARFSSTQMYGGIYDISFLSLSYKKHAEIEVDIFVKDSVNGDGRFIQNFTLVQKQNQWLIQRISLLKTDRAEKGWNLKLVNQPGLTSDSIEEFLQLVYDTLGSKLPENEIVRDLERVISQPQFFQMPDGVYAVVVAENRLPGSAINTGWCDAFVFQQKGVKWGMADFKLNAGGSGMYGNSGGFSNLLRVGDNVTGVVITGGHVHMGDQLTFDDILAIENGKLYNLVSVTTAHRYGEFGVDYAKDAKMCDENVYRFIKSDKQNYDLQIIHTSCLGAGKGKEIGRVVIPCLNKTYKVPESFVHMQDK